MVGFIPYSHGEVKSNNNASNMLYPLDSQPFGIGYIGGAEGFHRLIYIEPSNTNIVTDTYREILCIRSNWTYLVLSRNGGRLCRA